MLSSTFTWSDHIEYISCKVNKNLGLLRRIKYYLPYDARLPYDATFGPEETATRRAISLYMVNTFNQFIVFCSR